MSTLKTNNIQHVDRSEPSILINTDGGVSIAGTLTYEDVTNVDSVGIITARGLSIFGNTTGLQVASGISTFQAVTATSGTFTGGIDVTSNVTISDSIVHSGDTNTKIRFPAADTITTEVGGNEILRITSDSDILTQGLTNHTFNNDGSNTKVLEVTGAGSVGQYGIVNVSGNQNSNAVVGAVKFINRENSNSSSGANANSRRIAAIDCFADTSDSNGGDDCGGVLRFVTKADGGGGAEQMRIRSWGDVNISNRLRVAGISTFTGNIFMPDSAEIRLGASGDMQLFHDPSSNNIINNQGSLTIKKTDGDKYIHCSSNAQVELYYDNDKKFETAAIGNYAKSIMPSSDNTYDLGQNVGRWRNLYISDHTGGNGAIFIGASNDMEFKHEGSFNYLVNHNSKNFVLQAKDGENAILTVPDGEVALYHNNHKTCQTTSAGFKVIDGTGANAELRVTATGTNRADMMVLAEGSGNANLWLDASNGDLSGADYANIFHNNSTLDLELHNYAADIILKVRNGSLGGGGLITAIHCEENGSVNLYHDGNRKFSTESTGPHLHGLSAGSGHSDLRYRTSDGRLYYDASTRLVKTDIVDSPYGIDTLKQLKPRRYKRTDIEGTPNEIGFIADEVVNVIPEIVPFGPKSFYTKNESDTEEIPVNVDYRRMTAVLTKALQEAVAKIETLEAKVAALEGS